MRLAPFRRPRGLVLPGVASLVLLLGSSGCGPATPEPSSPSPTASASASTAPSVVASTAPTATPTSAPTSEPEAIAPSTKPGVPVESSPPPGTQPLTEPEQKELASKCKKLGDAIVAAAKKGGAKKRPIDYANEVLSNPPKLPGVDVPRCSELIRRDTIDYLARTRENEAKLNMKRIVVGLMTALEREPPELCAGAPAVPKDLASVKDAPYASTADDWKDAGWKCARFDLVGGQQVFQYELRTDKKTLTYEVIARGYPVQGAPATELFISGKVDHGAIDPSMPVMRR